MIFMSWLIRKLFGIPKRLFSICARTTRYLFCILRYFKRFTEEIEQINTKNSIGKRNNAQHSSRLQAIQMTLTTEKDEYDSAGIGKD